MKLIERILNRYFCEKIFEEIQIVPYFLDFKRVYTKDYMIIYFKKDNKPKRYYKKFVQISRNNALKTYVYDLDNLRQSIIERI
jgi:2-phosphoglycerate kinase